MTDNRITKDTMRIVLEIAKAIALSDGNISAEEKELICDLPNQYAGTNVYDDDLKASTDATLSLKGLVACLQSHEDRCYALRIAYLVAAVSKQPRDREYINIDERHIYKNLIDELHLSESIITEIERSAKKELNENRSPVRILMDLIFGEEGLSDLRLEKLYYAEGRNHPDHPLHKSYVGLTADAET